MKLHRIVLFVDDLEASIRFYKSTFNFPILEERTGWIEFDTGGSSLALHQGKGRKPRFEYVVPDLIKAQQQANERGWKCTMKEGITGVSYLEGKDKDGNSIRIVSST